MIKKIRKLRNKYLKRNFERNINKLCIDDFINKYSGKPFFDYEKVDWKFDKYDETCGPQEAYIFKMKNVTVYSDYGALFYKNNMLPSLWQTEWFKRILKQRNFPIFSLFRKRIKGTVLNMTNLYAEMGSHLWLDVYSKWFIYQHMDKFELDKVDKILLPSLCDNKRDLDLLEMLGVDLKKIIFMKPNKKVLVENLIFDCGANHSGWENSFKYYKNIVEKLHPDKQEYSDYKKIYVSRRDKRVILNEDELMKVLSEYGYKKIYFEDYPYIERMKLLQNVDKFISIFGSSTTNILFSMKESMDVIEIVPSTFAAWVRTSAIFCEYRNYTHFYYVEDNLSIKSGTGLDDDITLNVDKFIDYVKVNNIEL